jgi:ABC-type multidrug transport system ATPase subunit
MSSDENRSFGGNPELGQASLSPRSRSRLQEHFASSRSKDEHITMEWEDINFSVITKDSRRGGTKNNKILKNVNGRAESGQLLAIMGPTGCGKTSLLNVLAARVPSGGKSASKLSGNILINGAPRDDEKFRRISAYVLQDDKMYPHLTVYETLMLAAHFYLPNSVSDDDKNALVMSVIEELGLRKAKDTIIGDEKVRGVSGGERRRANIGQQLISDPVVLFLDEPTSGLDSFQAMSVMESMKNLALNGRLVVSVIHQPRSSIYEMFDRIVLLSMGRTIYLGVANEAVDFFRHHGYLCPPSFNPSDYFLDVLSPDSRTPELEAEADARITSLADAWADQERSIIDAMGPPKSSVDISAMRASAMNTDCARVSRNFKLLCWRSSAEQTREIPTIMVKLFVTCFFALIIGGIYSNVGLSQKSISNRIGLLFVICLNQSFNGTLGVLNTFPKEKTIVNRERSNYAYDTLSYFIAKFIVELPLNILPATIFSCIIYFIVGLNKTVFGYFILITIMTAVTAIALGMAISAAAPNIELALALGPPCIVIALLFGGFYINLDSLPIVANGIPYVSFLRWGFQALCTNEFSGETFECTSNIPGMCETTGTQVLKRLNFNYTTETCVLGLGMVLVGFLISAYVFLYFSKITYTPLGHVGRKQMFYKEKDAIAGQSTKRDPNTLYLSTKTLVEESKG